MSVKLMSAIFETEFRDLPDENGNTTKASTAKLVLLALADHANDEGESAYPSISRLARKTALSEQTIRNTLDALRYNGIVYLKGTSKYRTNNYTIFTGAFPRLMGENDDILTLKPLEGLTGEGSPSNRSPEPLNRLDPNHHITIPETPKEVVQNLEDETWFKFEEKAQQEQQKAWVGRETFRPDHYPLVDWYHEKTGQDCPKSKQKDWHKAVMMWEANNLTVDDLQAAYDMDIKWRGVFTSPNQLTDKAIALRAQGGRKSDGKPSMFRTIGQ